MAEDFPEGMQYEIRYDTTPFIRESIAEVYKTLQEAVILVAVVVLLFLQNWRSAIIPLIAVPVAIIGTFAVMAALGFSLNNLTLFGLVLAIGIVVDDAIVVVEAVEHHMEHGLAPREATIVAMEEVSGPVIAIGLVLTAVFVPCAFITGIVGQFFRQFALTIAASTSHLDDQLADAQPGAGRLAVEAESGWRQDGRGVPTCCLRLILALIGGWVAYAMLARSRRATTARPDAPRSSLAGMGRGRRRGRGRGDRGRARRPAAQLVARPVLRGLQRYLPVLDTASIPAESASCSAGRSLVVAIYGGLLYLTHQAFVSHADRLHPVAGHGLSARQRAAARLGLDRAHGGE